MTIDSPCFDAGFGSVNSGRVLAAEQQKIGLKQALLCVKKQTTAAKAAQAAANQPVVQPVQQATVPIVQQPATAQPTPLQVALQSSSFKCDHSCPVVSSQPVLVVSPSQVLCAAVAVIPQNAPQVVPAKQSMLPVLLLTGIVLWLVFCG